MNSLQKYMKLSMILFFLLYLECVKGVAVEKNGACQCGETPCPEGKFCIGDQCLDEMPIVETACKSTPRPAEYLEVWSVKLDTTNQPGYYFEFDEAAGRKYFDQSKVHFSSRIFFIPHPVIQSPDDP